LEGAITTKKLLKLCNENNMPAVAITDTSNMFGALEISELLSKDGIQPVIGCQLEFLYDPKNKNLTPRPIVLLAKNEIGYQNLMKLSTIAYLKHDDNNPLYNIH
jgi:DNA polymerase III, alpha subunit